MFFFRQAEYEVTPPPPPPAKTLESTNVENIIIKWVQKKGLKSCLNREKDKGGP